MASGHPEADAPGAIGEHIGGQGDPAGLAGCGDQPDLWLRSWAGGFPQKKLDDGWPESEKDVCQAALSIAAVKRKWIE